MYIDININQPKSSIKMTSIEGPWTFSVMTSGNRYIVEFFCHSQVIKLWNKIINVYTGFILLQLDYT